MTTTQELPAEMTAAEYLAWQATQRRSKYGNVPVAHEDGRFDSTGEAERWDELKLLQRLGTISGLARQVAYALVVNGVQVATYKADFVYEEEGRLVVEDWKGYRTSEYRMKAALMRACHNITIRETGR